MAATVCACGALMGWWSSGFHARAGRYGWAIVAELAGSLNIVMAAVLFVDAIIGGAP